MSQGEQAGAAGATEEVLQVWKGGWEQPELGTARGAMRLIPLLADIVSARHPKQRSWASRRKCHFLALHLPAVWDASATAGVESKPAQQACPSRWQALADWNARYEAKFGHVFIICASGRSAEEMLAAVQRR